VPRNPSTLTKAALFAQETGSAFWYLLELSHASLATPLRFCTNNEKIARLGEDWFPTWFEITLPAETSEQQTKATITIENIDRTLVDALQTLDGPLDVKIYITPSHDTSTIGPFRFKWRETDWDAQSIKGSLEPNDLLNELWPKDEFIPSKFPGLFR
jgi:hypothetical protein